MNAAPTRARCLRAPSRAALLALARPRGPATTSRSSSSSSSSRRVVGVVTRAVLDAEGIPWQEEKEKEKDEAKKKSAPVVTPPRGLAMAGADDDDDDDAFPGESLPELAEQLRLAVEMDFKDSMYDECVVDMTPFGIEECYGDVSNAVAEVCVSAHAAETAGNFNMALRRKELRRLRAALWELRVTLERQSKDSGHCTLTVRHKLEALRSASLDVCHPQMRAANAPNATAIPNFQAVHQDFRVDALPDVFADSTEDSIDDDCEVEAEIAFYRGGQPTAEGRAWLAERGFKTVIDLRFEDRDNQWTKPFGGGVGVGKRAPRLADDAGFEVVHMPVTDMEPPTFELVERFIEVANDRARRPMLVHCKAGIGRTGSMVSCWRISRGMDVDEALALESLCCDFGSIAQETFVRSFADRLAKKKRNAAATIVESVIVKGAGAAYEGAGFLDVAEAEEVDAIDARIATPPPPPLMSGGEGMGSGGVSAEAAAAAETQPAPASSLEQAPDMYVIRTDGFTCTREEVEDGMLKISHPSTQQLVLVWRKPPKRILVLKKLGPALLPQLVEVSHAMLSMGFEVVVEENVVGEMREEKAARDAARRSAAAGASGPGGADGAPGTSLGASAIRDLVLENVESVPDALARVIGTNATTPTEYAGVDLIVCLGGDGVILHASKLFQGPVPPLLGFHFGSMGFLTNHPPDHLAQSLLQSVGRGSNLAGGIKGGIPITLRMRLECSLVKANDSVRNGGDGAPSHAYAVLNEVLVDRGPSPFLSKIEAYDRGLFITTIQADGVMLATATGSTAYSVSAGGSMVHPNVPAILMTPICPHTLSFRPVILPDSVEMELRVADDARCSAWVSFDGKERCELCAGDSIFVRMSECPVPTINYADQTGDFISSLRRCLRWNEREEQKPLDEKVTKKLRKMAQGRVDLATVDLTMDESQDDATFV